MMGMLIPLDFWGDFLNVLNGAMYPLYWAVSGILVGFHWLLTFLGMPFDSGWTWTAAIALLTVVIRTALIPLFVKQINSSRNMQLLQPKVKEINEKWGHDRERLGQETMKLYKDEGVNPMASCLPLLLQMPIFIALFTVLNSVFRAADPSGVIGYFFQQDWNLALSLKKATIFGASISSTFMPVTSFGPTQYVALALIVLMTIVLFITQLQLLRKNMPPEALTGPMAQQQKMMLYIFPVIYAITGVSIPIGVLIYWLTTNLWTMGQQYILIHNNPAPGTPAYVDWEERQRAKGRDPEALAAKRRGSKRPPASAEGGTTVKRQGAESAESASAPTDEPQVQRQVVQRQQPRRNTRAKRKK